MNGTAKTLPHAATSVDNLSKATKEIDAELPDAKDRYWTCVVDIANLDSVRSWIEETVAKFGKLDGAANVAAVEQREIFPITDLDPEYFARLLNVNVVGTFHCLKEEMKVIKDGGSIVNVGSIASHYGTPGTSAYVAAKHALIGLTKVAAFEGASRRIRVNALCPGCFNTEMMTKPFNSAAGEFHLNKDNIPCILNRELPETWEIAGSRLRRKTQQCVFVRIVPWDGSWDCIQDSTPNIIFPIDQYICSEIDTTMPLPYADADITQLQRDADDNLLTYGTAFHPEIITSTDGINVQTASGHRMMDFTSGQMSTLIGHGHPEVVKVIADHAQHLDHLFSGMISPPVINLAKRLTGVAPAGLDKAFFLSTGGEANEAAIRLAKFYTGKWEIVGLAASWHGMTGGSLGAQYHAGRSGYGPNMIGNLALPTPNSYRSIFRHADGTHDWKTELDYGFDLVDKQSCGSLAAAIVEPILSSGGMLELPPGYLKALKEHCVARGMLLIVDEAQTALGRAGDMFAFTHYPEDEGVVPDIVTLSKTLGNGIPLSAVLTSNRIAQHAKDNGFLFYTTHINDPLPAAVGDKVLEIVMRDELCARSKRLGVKLQAGLRRLQSRYGCIGDVRGRGLMAGMEIVGDRKTKVGAPEVGAAVSTKIAEMGLWAQLATMASFGGVFRIAPPITVTEEQIDLALSIIEEALATTPGTMPLYTDVTAHL
ncbi:hypothetical protein J4E81_001137 [Alternaria sp. BMP 2799]|nr:hypothetical protein J4E81_001137 [Alternaria sp. BMP 2799]